MEYKLHRNDYINDMTGETTHNIGKRVIIQLEGSVLSPLDLIFCRKKNENRVSSMADYTQFIGMTEILVSFFKLGFATRVTNIAAILISVLGTIMSQFLGTISIILE